MTSEPTKPPAGAPPLPKVEPPSAAFIIQLFLVPLAIVGVIVMLWMTINFLAFSGEDPEKLIAGIERLNDASWQKAATLADLLRNPRYDEIKRDPRIARRLGEALEKQLAEGSLRANNINLRMFLARALGEFHVPDGLPALIEAARIERDANEPRDPARYAPKEVDVRRAAIEAIAVLADHVGPETLRGNQELLDALSAAAAERSADDPANDRAMLRQTAAFTLGVIGGERALDQLERMLDDPYPHVRYNAATGLARHGDSRATPTLEEMLDPENDEAAALAQQESGAEWNRSLVLINAIRAVDRLVEENPQAEVESLVQPLESLSTSKEVTDKVRSSARVTLNKIKPRS